jgi:UDP-N-acetylglucosamine 2-epimerase (non-hydrolysing)
MRKKILIVVGTRPEAIKMAPLIHLLREDQELESKTCVTAQHRELLDQVLDDFKITPDYDLDLMIKGQDLYELSSRVLLSLKKVLQTEQPDMVLVHGDTTTSSMAALAAFYAKIPIGHIEAGLRTHNLMAPWPEEANRQITGRLARFHFAPTQRSKENLLLEGIKEEYILITGNTVIDALKLMLNRFEENPELRISVTERIIKQGVPSKLLRDNSSKDRIVLITGHRRENFGIGFMNICESIKSLSENFPDTHFIYPMHFNPNVRKPIENVFGPKGYRKSNFPNIHFIEPLPYMEFVLLMSKSDIILTDSGGIQEEAPSLGKPVLVMRDTTERPEAVDAGTVELVGTDQKKIISSVTKLLTNKEEYNKISKTYNPYGEGQSSERIIRFLKQN